MADRIVQLQDKDGNNVYPISTIQASDSAKITMTSTDPGEGAPLAANNFIAVYDSMGSLLDMFYPVGSYYETSNTSFDPNVSWGGTWVEDSAGYATVAYASGDTDFGTVGGTGGEKTHVLSLAEMPKHRHYTSNANAGTQTQDAATTNASSHGDQNYWRFGSSSGRSDYQGSSAAHNNLQPYVVVKRWHRTA